MEVARYLDQLNIRVLPRELYCFPNAQDLRRALQNDLGESTLFVQLLCARFKAITGICGHERP